jgi:hypothetical protein
MRRQTTSDGTWRDFKDGFEKVLEKKKGRANFDPAYAL